MFAEVIIERAAGRIDKYFHYAIPAKLIGKIEVGQQVIVPFGRRREIGYVVGFSETADVKEVKEIFEATPYPPLFGPNQVKLARWLAEYYGAFFISALKLMLPPGGKLRKEEKEVMSLEAAKAEPPSLPILTEEQKNALTKIEAAMDHGQAERFLLYGITGSGKTEVYLRAIAHTLSKGKGAIVLVPEISLTPQMVQRFNDRYPDKIALLHSGLTSKERYQAWKKVAAGKARIVLGTRSALFAPVKNLGLIVMDEEYEATYKSEKSPRYHVREVAAKLAEISRAIVIMGSATPSLETYYQCEEGQVKKISLTKRIDDRPLPPVEIIDMKESRGRLLSDKLRKELKATLDKGEQAILFINRRGYFTFAICKECGGSIDCPHCSVSLTYHSDRAKLVCGHCGYSTAANLVCPRCHSLSLAFFGVGTQRIEKEVAEVFPAARILRYDRDAVTKRGSHEALFATFASGQADVLIGTQMVAKGLDIAKVTLVGVVAAETMLHLPDFRSAERTFQMITQVAGRAGRHALPGKVIIQTYTPGHYAIQAAAKHDYDSFYRQEIEFRRELNYPPFSRLISLVVSGEEKEASQAAEEIGRKLKEDAGSVVLGPAPMPISKIRGEWRHHLLIKMAKEPTAQAKVFALLKTIAPTQKVRVTVDVDPMNML